MLDGAEPGPVTLVVPSFLVAHDNGLVLFGTGLGPEVATDPVAAYGEIGGQVSFEPAQRVGRQIESVGFTVSDVTHVVVSQCFSTTPAVFGCSRAPGSCSGTATVAGLRTAATPRQTPWSAPRT